MLSMILIKIPILMLKYIATVMAGEKNCKINN